MWNRLRLCTRLAQSPEPESGSCAWMQSATALAGWACTKTKAHPVGKLRLLGKPRRLNELCFCAALNCRVQVEWGRVQTKKEQEDE